MGAPVHRHIERIRRIDARHAPDPTCRSQKNVADAEENSPNFHPASIHSSMAAMNARFKSEPGGSSRDSITVPYMLRTTYQRGAAVGSSGS